MKTNTTRPLLTLLMLIAPQFIIGAMIIWKVHNPNDYLVAITDKHAIAAQTVSPKILMVGGSSIGWGTDSETFTDQTGLPCVNLGINAGQGLDYRFNEASAFANSGDVIVLSLEYYELSLDPTGFVVTTTMAASPSGFFRFAGWREYRSMLDEGIFELLSKRTRMASAVLAGKFKLDKLYHRDNFNSQGDFVGHHGRDSDNQNNWGLLFSDDPDLAFVRLEKFVQGCRDNNIRVFYRLPCVPESLAHENLADMKKLEENFKQLFGDDMLNEIDETLLPDDSFFDTSYHLVEAEKKRISDILAVRLARKLPVSQLVKERNRQKLMDETSKSRSPGSKNLQPQPDPESHSHKQPKEPQPKEPQPIEPQPNSWKLKPTDILPPEDSNRLPGPTNPLRDSTVRPGIRQSFARESDRN